MCVAFVENVLQMRVVSMHHFFSSVAIHRQIYELRCMKDIKIRRNLGYTQLNGRLLCTSAIGAREVNQTHQKGYIQRPSIPSSLI